MMPEPNPRFFFANDLHVDIHTAKTGKPTTLTSLGVDLSLFDGFVLPGDIITNGYPQDALPLLQEINDTGKPTLMILGNHEYFEQVLAEAAVNWQAFLHRHQLHNVHLLDLRTQVGKTIAGIHFVGTTCWYSAGKNPIDGKRIDRHSVDHKWIIANPETGRHFNYKDSYAEHLMCLDAMSQAISELRARHPEYPVVALIHHAPSVKGLPLQPANYSRNEMIRAKGFYSDLNQWMAVNQPELVLHGHTHIVKQYRMGDTLVASNALGYPPEADDDAFEQRTTAEYSWDPAASFHFEGKQPVIELCKQPYHDEPEAIG
ncbi:metallophosphoesterase family protein [Ferrimonas marina]|uniref:Calcineurin-like phosphoesterase n=1 Tax=Ferrimonas marina TaxID=299255 RepID=A0A1M5UHL4_9GAMM|nr:metallophosphoesterase [Ferrimonas marina]SHH62410.1 Calcineurin-like phosphoesterase [Ferrimonas marina]